MVKVTNITVSQHMNTNQIITQEKGNKIKKKIDIYL